MSERILIVDDDSDILDHLDACLTPAGYEVTQAGDGEKALRVLKKISPSIVITDICMPKMSGMALLKEIKKKYPEIDVIVMTTNASIENAVEAMINGAFDYIPKPISVEEITMKLDRLRKIKKQEEENVQLRKQLHKKYGFGSIIGKSKIMQNLFDKIQMVTDSDTTVIIQGPSGTGKELVAGALHYNSPRRNGPFIKVGCGIFNQEILESELFGHEKGAFTGALRNRPGRFEMADGGSIFLDDVDDIPISTQLKLLRVLQEREFEKVGGEKTIKVNVRVIAATKVDLKKLVVQGKFREDLYFRLKVIPLILPPLSDRKEDIPLLLKHFIEKYNKKKTIVFEKTPADVLKTLQRYPWPGNIRELENAVEHAVTFCQSNTLLLEHFPEDIIHSHPLESGILVNFSEEDSINFNKAVQSLEKTILEWAWGKESGHQGSMAQMLGLPRTTLRDKLITHNLLSKKSVRKG